VDTAQQEAFKKLPVLMDAAAESFEEKEQRIDPTGSSSVSKLLLSSSDALS